MLTSPGQQATFDISRHTPLSHGYRVDLELNPIVSTPRVKMNRIMVAGVNVNAEPVETTNFRH